MFKVLIDLSRYVFVFLMAIYVFMTYRISSIKDDDDRAVKCVQQIVLLMFIHFLAYVVMFVTQWKMQLVALYLIQAVCLVTYLIVYHLIYNNCNSLFLNNTCMLMVIGFIMITRLSLAEGVRQFIFVMIGCVLTLIIPAIMTKVKTLRNIPWLYGVIGILLLFIVLIVGELSYGANIQLSIGGISLQPSEFVKIIYVFFIAAMFNRGTNLLNVIITTVMAAVHVIILVLSKDLGSALIFFVIYLAMLYVATRSKLLVFAGLGSGAIASVVAYKLFAHVRTRVLAWKNPWDYIDGQGYQITQSLFAIGMGSWFGCGLNQGMPEKIPLVEMDFMFSAICEEMGIIFAIGVILMCLNTFMLMMDVGMKSKGKFYRLLAIGLAAGYGFQIFLTIGGGIKFIPLTGVTLPLISYGGSSAFSTLIMFGVIQGLFMLRMNER